jgi:curli biogenesis system outer membrane secretion channel CsgG
MKRSFLNLSVLIFTSALVSCFEGCLTTDGGGLFSSSEPRVTGGGISALSSERQLAAPTYSYDGPKIRIAVQTFENKTGQVMTAGVHGGQYVVETDPIGRGMADQLVTALMQTGIFSVIERQQIADVQAEKQLTGQGQENTLAKPDYFVYGSVTEFKKSQSSASSGMGLGGGYMSGSAGGGFGILANAFAAAITSSQDHVVIDIRVVDARTGEVVGAASVDGKAKDLSGALGGVFGNTLLGVSGEYRTPEAKAVRACIIKAVNWLGNELINRENAKRAPIVSSTSGN